MIKRIESKVRELNQRIKTTDVRTDTAECTKRTTLAKLRRELRRLELVEELVKQADISKLSERAQETLKLMTTPVEEYSVSRVTCKVGDTILSLMQEYDGTHNLLERLGKYAQANGMKLDFKTGTVVAA